MLMLLKVTHAFSNEEIMADATANFQSNVTLVATGNSVNFLDLTTGSPVSWSWTFDGGTPSSYSGQIPPPVYYNSSGTYNVTLVVMDANGDISTEVKPSYIEVMDAPSGWEVVQTGVSHLISVPLSVEIFGDPLAYGDFLGVFYLDENNAEKCGGFTIWDGTNNKVVTAFGDDITTNPEKEGFDDGETLNWKVYFTQNADEKTAAVTYNQALPNNDGTYADNGLSSLTQIYTGALEASAEATPDNLCAGDDVQLSANASGGTTNYTYSWSSDPVGFSSTLANPFANPAVNTTYTVVVDDGISNVNSSVGVTVAQGPIAQAGSDQSVCMPGSVSLSGTVQNESSIQWTTSGSGTFGDEAQAVTTYYPSANDIIIGSATLTLIAGPIDPCTLPDSDELTVTLENEPSVLAGDDQSICEGTTVILSGQASYYCSLEWTSDGDGTFDDELSASTTYYPGTADINNGSVLLCLAAGACSPCLTDADDCLTLTIEKAPSASAGNDVTLCEDDNLFLSGVAADYCNLTWTTDGDGTFSDNSIQEPTYYPGSADIASGLVELCIEAQACNPCLTDANDCMQLTIQKQPTANVGLDVTVCEGEEIPLEASVANHCGLQWTSNGDGIFGDDNAATTSYIPGPGDILGGGAALCLTAQACNPCELSAEDCLSITIQKSPTVSAGDDVSLCEDENLILSGVAANYCNLTWTTDGDGTFSDNSIQEPTYYPGSADLLIGLVALCVEAQACNPCLTDANDCMQLTIQKQPTANIGLDVTICEGEEIPLEASVANHCGLQWISDGDGIFGDDNAATTNYTPGPGDILAGGAELCLTANACNPCEISAIDCLNVSIQKAVSAGAGQDATICEGSTYELSDAFATNYSLIQWMILNGNGEFDNDQSENPVYTPSPLDVQQGCVTLQITAEPISPCAINATDDMELCIQQQSTVNAGSDVSLCENESHYLLDANATNYETLLWTSNGDGTFDDASAMNPTYYPGVIDLNLQQVTLSVTVSAIGPCTGSISDDMQISIQPKPIANAGDDATIPEDESYVNTDASATNYSSFVWGSDGDGLFDDANSLHPTYTPGENDITNGSVSLCLTAEPLSPCQLSDVDCLTVVVGVAPNVFAGQDASVCEGESLNLNQATADNYLSILWLTDGDGTFSDDAIVNPVYYPGTADVEIGNVELCITAQPNPPSTVVGNNCMTLTIEKLPAVNAGSDKTICEGAAITLNETTASNYAQLQWSATNGSGQFSNPNALKPTYTPSQSDYQQGCITLSVFASPNDPCTVAASDDMQLCFQLLPVALAGDDFTICETETAQLGGNIENACGYFWETLGDGVFDSFDALDAIYSPGISDLAAGTVTLCFTASACNPCTVEDVDCLTISLQPVPVVNAGANATICEDAMFTTEPNFENTCGIIWTSTGDGQFVDPTEALTDYTPGAGDINAGEVTLCIEALPCSPCEVSATDCMTLSIQIIPSVTAGANATICEGETYLLSDAFASNYSQIQWTTLNGSGSFDSDQIQNTVYIPSFFDYQQGCVLLSITAEPITPCTVSANDAMELCFQLQPSVNAGADVTLCEGEDYYLADAFAENYNTIQWGSNGDGVFDDASAENPTYYPGTLDVESQQVTLTFTGFPLAPCSESVSDNMQIAIQPKPLAFAGDDATISEDEAYTLTTATAVHYSSLAWESSGDGGFDNSDILNPTYSPGIFDIENGIVTLCISAIPIDPCTLSTNDCMELVIGAYPVVSAGPDAVICEDNIYSFDESVAQNYLTLLWESSGDGTFSSATDEHPTYYPGEGDLGAGSVDICLSAEANPPATGTFSDCMTLTFQTNVTVYAGPDVTLCEGQNFDITEATAINYAFVQWAGISGTGEFINGNQVLTTYIPGFLDYLQGTVTLQLTATPIDPCTTLATDQVQLTFQKAPQANAGNDQTLCEDGFASLDGIASDACGTNWFTSFGDGQFGDAQSLNTEYYPGELDKQVGFVEICLEAYACDPCTVSDSDCLILAIQMNPIANAGPDGEICENESYNLSGSVENACGSMWDTQGDGQFSDPANRYADYTPGEGDIANGFVEVCLTADPCDPCVQADSDCMIIEIQSLPSANAGDDATICETDSYQILGASVDNFSAIQWTTTGSGFFDNPNGLNPTYFPSFTDALLGCISLQINVQSINPCEFGANDNMELCFQQGPAIDAGEDAVICVGETFEAVATSENACGIIWTTNGDGVFNNNLVLDAIYTPGPTDIVSGFVEICVTAEACAPCTESVEDCVIISFQPQPIANAGPNDGVLAGDTYVFENASAENYSSVLWETQGDGVFDDPAALNPAYTPGEGDIANYQVVLCLNALPINPCQVSDQDCMILQIGSMPVITAGPDVAVCMVGEYNLSNATAENYSSIQWSTSGDGTFDDNNAVTPTYFMGEDDLAAQSVELCMHAEPVAPATISANDCMTLSLVLEPTAAAGDDVTLCGNQPYILQATATEYCEIEWTTSGNGVFNNNSLVQPSYTPGAGDIANGSVELCISAIPCDPCTIAANDCMTMYLFDAPIANAGNNVTICENKTVSLSGSVSNNCGFYWESQGDGLFSNNASLNPVYTPGELDIENGLAVICLFAEPCDPCSLPVSDCMELSIYGLPQPNPGADASICFGDSYQLSATLENGCGFFWQSSGDGSFSNTGSLTATYYPGTNDYANGSVQLCLFSFPCTPCTNFSTECMTLSFVSDPSVDAGDDVTVCSTDPYMLQPIIQDACGVVWTSTGDGAFDNSSLVNATYTPGSNDLTSGQVELCITGLPCGSCETPDSDCMTISYLPGQTVDAGFDLTICEDQTAPLSGIATNNCGTEWSTSGDGTFNDISIPEAIYTPGENDLANGSAILTFTALPCEPCNGSISDELTLTFVPQPYAFAGDDAAITAGENYEITNAVAQNASAYGWTTSGDGQIDNPESLSPTYTPGSGDELSGSVDLCLIVQPLNPCVATSTDCLTLSIASLPTANAGPDATICETNNFFIDGASATNYSAIIWSTGGDGTFNDDGTEQPVYYPGIDDLSNGSVQLCMTVQAQPPATQTEEDCMTLNFQAQPEANAGADATICSGDNHLLSGGVQNACGASWSTNGDGFFNDDLQLAATYTPGVQDVQNGFVTLCLTAEPCDPCQIADVDCMTLVVSGIPEAYAGDDTTICEDLEYLVLEVNVQNACTTLWTTSGTGTFDDATMANAKYYPGEADINNEFVELCLNVEACNPCEGSDQDCVAISIIKLPVANAGGDWTICEDETFTLQGSATFNCGLSWSADGNGSFDNPNIQNPTYTPGPQDIAAGFVEICVEAFACNPCSISDVDCMTLFIESNPVVDAGNDATICETDSYTLQATVENSCGLQWTSLGSGEFDNTNILNPTYTPGLFDLLNGSVELCLSTQSCSPCSSGVQDCVVLYFAPLPEANAGEDAIVCEGGEIQLNGSALYSCNAMWSTSGDGEFDNATLLDATYTPGALDAAQGTVQLCLIADACDPCSGSDTDCITLSIRLLPLANAGQDVTICSGDEFDLSGEVTNACNWIWSSNGDGGFVDEGDLFTSYTPGEQDIENGSVELCLTAGPCDPCTVSDVDCMTISIQQNPVANAGSDATICEGQSLSLAGSGTDACGFIWTTTGSGEFGDETSANTQYQPSSQDIDAGTVELCLSAFACDPCSLENVDCLTLSIVPNPTANAGEDQVICETETIALQGSAENYCNLQWTSNGSGQFDDENILNPVYTPGIVDINLGSVELCMFAQACDPCTVAASDCMTLTIQAAPEVVAGSNGDVCENGVYSLQGSVDNACGNQWSTNGDGVFGDNGSLSTTYTPGSGDIAQGFVELCLTAEACEPCIGEASSCLTLTIIPLPVVTVPDDNVICESEIYCIEATASNYSSIIWSGGGGFDNVFVLNPCYTPTSADITNGSVELTLTAQPMTPCIVSVQEAFTLSIQQLPLTDAGNDMVICNGETAQLSGIANNFASIIWTGGDGTFDDAADLNATYTPGPNDLQNGEVVLQLAVTAIDPCDEVVYDDLLLQIQSLPVAFAGDDINVCENGSVQLSGQAENGSSVKWETTGDGTFSNPFSLNTLYFLGNSDVSNGSFTASLQVNPIAPCSSADVDDLIVNIQKLPIVNAGANKVICQDQTYVLQGTASNYAQVFWSTSGDGFFDDVNNLNATYTPGTGDIAAGSTFLTLTANASEPCSSTVQDAMKLFITKAPVANAGNDATICETKTVTLNGSISYSSLVNWSSSGDGLFNNPNKLKPIYGPGANDRLNGSVQLTLTALPISPCQVSDDDFMVLTLQKLPTVFAGNDQTVCYDENALFNEAVFTAYSSVQWFTSNGQGTFDDVNSLSPTYFPNPDTDYDLGCISIGVTAQSVNPCNTSATDFVKLCFQASPKVNAGLDAVVCESNYYLLVTASADDYSSLMWSSEGDGSFTDPGIVRAEYYPGENDILTGEIQLCLTAQAIDPCSVFDQDCMMLSIEPGVGPTLISAEPGDSEVALAFEPIAPDPVDTDHFLFDGGNAANIWTILLNTTYINGLDVEAGDEIAIFDNGLIVGQTTFTGPVIPDTYTEKLLAYRELNDGPGYTPGQPFLIKFWDESLGTEVEVDSYQFSDPNNQGFYFGDVFPNVDNSFSLIDLEFVNPDAPKFNIYLVDGTVIATEVYEYDYLVDGLTNGEEYCFYITQVLPDGTETCPSNILCVIPFVPCIEPVVFAGNDTEVCSGESFVLNDATATNYEFIQWSTSGDGTFDDAGALNPAYSPGPSDLNDGSVQLCVSAIGFYPCGIVADCVSVTFKPEPEIDLGPDEDQICIGGTFTSVLATAENYASVLWYTSDGSGTFDDPTQINPTYYPTQGDIALGCITLAASAAPIDPCSNAAYDEMTLCLVLYPDIEAGADINICLDTPYQLYGEAENYIGVIWTTSGDGTFDNDAALDPVYTPGIIDQMEAGVDLTLTVYPESPCVEIAIDVIHLGLYPCQVTIIPEGWSGVSSYLDPADKELDVLFAPILNELVIIQTMEESWWPEEGFNTIGNWDMYQGYKIKVTEEVEMTIPGTTPDNRTLSLNTGWNLIPVLSSCAVDAEDLFQQTGVVMIKEVAGWRVYWPDLGINNLVDLQPGKAYYVFMANPGAVLFPDCTGLKTSGNAKLESVFEEDAIPASWKTFSPTASSHVIGVPARFDFNVEFEPGDVIGVFDNYDICFGYTVWDNENTSINAFADDPVTPNKDGFYEGEIITFRKYENATGNITEMQVEFSDEYPVHSGTFVSNAISLLKSLTVNSTNISFIENDKLTVYPNPVRNTLIIDYEGFENAKVRVMNLQGQPVYSGILTGVKTELDFSGLTRGVYLVHIYGSGVNRISRIIKQ